MADILHRVGIQSSVDAVFKALATREGLAGWWTDETRGECQVGGVIHFQFGERGFFDIKVLELQPASRVVWQVVDGPTEWIGTRVGWSSGRKTTTSSCSLHTRGGRNQWNSCTIAVPSGRCF